MMGAPRLDRKRVKSSRQKKKASTRGRRGETGFRMMIQIKGDEVSSNVKKPARPHLGSILGKGAPRRGGRLLAKVDSTTIIPRSNLV